MTQSTLDKLKTQQAKLNVRIQSLEARTKTVERKKDVRRKILVGSIILTKPCKQVKWKNLKQSCQTI